MIEFEVLREPRGETYGELLTFAGGVSATFGLVSSTRPNKFPAESYQHARDRLAADLASTSIVMEWPGSRSIVEHELAIYRVTPRSLAVLRELTEGLYDWCEAPLPADLHFLREDGSLVLGSCGSGRFAWLQLTDDEADRCPPAVMNLLQRGS